MPAISPFRAVLTDKVLRLTALLMILQGALACSFGPYISVLAVRVAASPSARTASQAP